MIMWHRSQPGFLGKFGAYCASLAIAIAGAACSIDADPLPPDQGAGGTTSGAGGTQPASSGSLNQAGTGNGGAAMTSGGVTSVGGQASGGSANAGTGGGPTGAGGSQAGAGNQAGAAGQAGAGGGGGGPLAPGNPAVKSAGCGKATTVTTGKKTIKSTNQDRTYIIDIPAGYDMNKPYRLFYTSHWIGSTSEAVRDQNYYFLKPLATAANEPAIFVAPQSDGDTWQQKDHALFDDILAYVKANLCIDETRVFATGFSFGGMITYSLSVNHQKDIRAAVGIAPANYNIYVPTKTHQPIAWMQTTGMGDGTCPWIQGSSKTNGAKFIGIEHATDNGCTVPADIPIWQQGNHVCYDFAGCKAGYPTKVCTFNGGHTNIANEGGTNWIPQESWKFFTQF
ncbi:MAG TPA: prolyl oligopeptidase family serine peptidase [Polyangiaceae bacterium]|nr:prolyl oligopeptidase family serine peptidase [Polyangiaceae bacterium]